MIRTYVDSGVLIEAYRGSGTLSVSAVAILSDPSREFITSVFVQLEVLPKPTFEHRLMEVVFYNTYFSLVVEMAPINEALIQLALQRAEQFGLSAIDALHVAAAETAGADEMVTAERPTSRLSRVTSIRVTSLCP